MAKRPIIYIRNVAHPPGDPILDNPKLPAIEITHDGQKYIGNVVGYFYDPLAVADPATGTVTLYHQGIELAAIETLPPIQISMSVIDEIEEKIANGDSVDDGLIIVPELSYSETPVEGDAGALKPVTWETVFPPLPTPGGECGLPTIGLLPPSDPEGAS